MADGQPQCKTCHFWEPDDRSEEDGEVSYGDCHRYPPSLVKLKDQGLLWLALPIQTFDDCWCGEWKA